MAEIKKDLRIEKEIELEDINKYIEDINKIKNDFNKIKNDLNKIDFYKVIKLVGKLVNQEKSKNIEENLTEDLYRIEKIEEAFDEAGLFINDNRMYDENLKKLYIKIMRIIGITNKDGSEFSFESKYFKPIEIK